MDEERSLSLVQLMTNEGLVPSTEEEDKRRNVIQKLKEIVLAWVKRVAWQRRLPKEQIAETHATILTYGSYGLGVHGSESDIDALCLGPEFATMAEDFFVVLHNMLKSRPEVSEIHCVKDAKVPLMRFKFDGILIDLPYARLHVLSVPENVDVLNPFFLRDLDETSWKSLSGVRANKCILQLVPDLELHGFLGGVHLAILVAHVCQNHPKGSLNTLVANFFKTYAYWPWPTPVMLQDPMLPAAGYPSETRSLMPIRLPCSPHEYCHSNITRSTFYKIRTEFLRGHNTTRDLMRPDFDWHFLFEPFPYSKKYARFVRVYLSASNQDDLGDWVGWVKSRFRSLILKLEEVQGLCDPNPTEYIDVDVTEPHVVFYWGLQPGRTNLLDIVAVEKDFLKNIHNGFQGSPGRMGLLVVQASQLSKSSQLDFGSGRRTKACWKNLDYNLPRIPVYSQHLPNYIIGYVDAKADSKYPSAGG
ncbi:nuclear poly(A) polymerase 3 [Citrus sinensis]|nr:nuclear poly(A) polymerase 3 [Citrus sinensis]